MMCDVVVRLQFKMGCGSENGGEVFIGRFGKEISLIRNPNLMYIRSG